jgi:hypothetical protein
MLSQDEPVLAMQDTVFFSYGRHPKTKVLGPIGKSDAPGERGLIMHNALAFTTAGMPLGLMSQCIGARGEIPEEDYQDKIVRLQCTAIEEKESCKWLMALRETHARTAGREGGERGRSGIGEREVNIPGNGKRKARTANVTVRSAAVTIKPPQWRGHAQDSASMEPLTANVIAVSEVHPPQGAESISCILLANLPVNTFTQASQKIDWYTKRWGIETWYKVLKSGCQVEDCMLEHAERLARYLALFSIIGERLMYIGYLAREQPDLPAGKVFSALEIEALHVGMTKEIPRLQKTITLKQTVRLIGQIGGHLGRKRDGEPGVTVLWRGWMRLYEVVTAVLPIKNNSHLINCS